jgi:hypothetical protein
MRRIRLLAAATVMASTMGIVGLAGSAGAATPSARSVHGLVINGFAPAKKKAPPNTNINPGPPVVFSPTSITGKKYGKSACAKHTKTSFTISNLTTSAQEVDFTSTAEGGGAPKAFTTIPVGDLVDVCSYGKIKAVPLLQLANNTNSVLTVTIT